MSVTKTKIEWTDSTWSPVRGCSRVSPGCMNCYAEGIAKRFSGPGLPYEGLIARTGQWSGQIKFIEEKLTEPLRWKKPRMIFVNSMSDLFHKNVPDQIIARIFAVMALCPQHKFQVLTKRGGRMQRYLSSPNCEMIINGEIWNLLGSDKRARKIQHGGNWRCKLPLKNVWLGVSCENQEAADERIPLLLQTPAAVRWISAEPLLGAVDLTDIDAGADSSIPREYWTDVDDGDSPPAITLNALTGEKLQLWGDWAERGPGIDWVVAGGESGRGARPSHPDWFRSLRDQCVSAGTKFFFKQWGEWREPLPGEEYDTTHGRAGKPPAFIVSDDGTVHCFYGDFVKNGKTMIRAGKKHAGRLLDGQLWDQYPEVQNV